MIGTNRGELHSSHLGERGLYHDARGVYRSLEQGWLGPVAGGVLLVEQTPTEKAPTGRKVTDREYQRQRPRQRARSDHIEELTSRLGR